MGIGGKGAEENEGGFGLVVLRVTLKPLVCGYHFSSMLGVTMEILLIPMEGRLGQ